VVLLSCHLFVVFWAWIQWTIQLETRIKINSFTTASKLQLLAVCGSNNQATCVEKTRVILDSFIILVA
jgi:hypothetical protein